LILGRHVGNRAKYKTPERFATEVVTKDAAPHSPDPLQVLQAASPTEEGRTLRVETTVNKASDFDLHKTLSSEDWTVLRRVGVGTNARYTSAQVSPMTFGSSDSSNQVEGSNICRVAPTGLQFLLHPARRPRRAHVQRSRCQRTVLTANTSSTRLCAVHIRTRTRCPCPRNWHRSYAPFLML
jgi:hypothetical protein